MEGLDFVGCWIRAESDVSIHSEDLYYLSM